MATRAGLDQVLVVRAAAELADTLGLNEVTLATLAEKLGVRTPTLYHYVDGLAGLRREIALLACRELTQNLGKSIMGKAGEEAVLAMAQAYRSFVNTHPGLYSATVQAADPADQELVAAQTEVVEVAIQTLASYHFEKEDAIHAVRMLRSLVHGFATLESSGGFGIPLDLNETFRRLLTTFLTALALPH